MPQEITNLEEELENSDEMPDLEEDESPILERHPEEMEIGDYDLMDFGVDPDEIALPVQPPQLKLGFNFTSALYLLSQLNLNLNKGISEQFTHQNTGITDFQNFSHGQAIETVVHIATTKPEVIQPETVNIAQQEQARKETKENPTSAKKSDTAKTTKGETVEGYFLKLSGYIFSPKPTSKEDIEYFKSILLQAKKENKIAELIRYASPQTMGLTIFSASLINHHELTGVILEVIQDNKKLLKETLEQEAGGSPVIIYALNNKSPNLLHTILAAINDDKELLEWQLFGKKYPGGRSASALTIENCKADKLEIICNAASKVPGLAEKIIREKDQDHFMLYGVMLTQKEPEKKLKIFLNFAAQNNKLEEVLNQKDTRELYPIYVAISISPKMAGIMLDAILDPKLLDKVLSKKNKQVGSFMSLVTPNSPNGLELAKILTKAAIRANSLEKILKDEENILPILAKFGDKKLTKTILETAEKNPELLKNLINQKLPNDLPVLSHLVMSEDWDSVGIILKHFPDMKLEKLPPSNKADLTAKFAHFKEMQKSAAPSTKPSETSYQTLRTESKGRTEL